MFAGNLIASSITPLSYYDSVEDALLHMYNAQVFHLPLVNDGLFLGLISLKNLIDVANKGQKLRQLNLDLQKMSVKENMHFQEVLKCFSQTDLSTLAVLDEEGHYLGVITSHQLMEAASEKFSSITNGAIIVLHIGNRENSLARIAQIVESDNAQILSSYVTPSAQNDGFEVTLKLNRQHVSTVVAAFERYDYEVRGVFQHDNSEDDTSQLRFHSFMKYLNV